MLVPRGGLEAMARTEFEDLYSMLLYEMTICWEEELNDAILAKMWQRDASSFQDLNYDRFCCSLFFYVEMWVDEVTQAAYDEIFNHIRQILSGHGPVGSTSTTPSAITFKPTLESFNTALDDEKAMEELNLNIGKSIFFDAAQSYHHFGTPEMPLRRVPSSTRLIEHQRNTLGTRAPGSTHQFSAKRGRQDQSSLCQHSQPSQASRLHMRSATSRIRPASSSHAALRSAAQRTELETAPQLKDGSGLGVASSSSSDPRFLMGKSALSPAKRNSSNTKIMTNAEIVNVGPLRSNSERKREKAMLFSPQDDEEPMNGSRGTCLLRFRVYGPMPILI